MNNQTTIGILGSGTWGIALARLLHRNGHDVTVWSKFPKEIENLSATRTHPALPGLVIPETVHFTCDLQTVASGKDILLFAVPSIAIRQMAESVSSCFFRFPNSLPKRPGFSLISSMSNLSIMLPRALSRTHS